VIEYSRGRIVVLDRERLEHLSCECYAQIRSETDRLLPRRAVPAYAEPLRHVARAGDGNGFMGFPAAPSAWHPAAAA
jgi:hypothetical protein